MDENSECRKLKLATDAAAKIQREYAAVNVPLPTPAPVQVGGEAVSLAGARSMNIMDELHQLRVERDGLLAQIGELRLEIEARDKTLDQLADIAEERDALLVRVETLEQQAQRRPPPMQATTPDAWQPDPTPYAELSKTVDAALRQIDVVAGSVAAVHKAHDWFASQGMVKADLEPVIHRLAQLEAKLAGIPVDAEHLDRIGRRFESHLARIERIEHLLCGGDDPEDALNVDDLPSYPDLVNRVEIKAARFSERIDRIERHITKSWGFTGWRGQP